MSEDKGLQQTGSNPSQVSHFHLYDSITITLTSSPRPLKRILSQIKSSSTTPLNHQIRSHFRQILEVMPQRHLVQESPASCNLSQAHGKDMVWIVSNGVIFKSRPSTMIQKTESIPWI